MFFVIRKVGVGVRPRLTPHEIHRKTIGGTVLCLDLGRTEGILRLRTPIKTDARFGKLGLDTERQDNLAQRWIDLETCADGKAYLPAVIMLGSILEGALIAKLKANIKQP